jgi:malonate decarboxylase alpha subunit
MKTTSLLEAVIKPGDRVCIEGNNQKQADFLTKCLMRVDPAVLHDLHMLQSVLALPEHLELLERGVARKLDFTFSGPQAGRLAKLLQSGRVEVGALHTYLELFARYFVDLTPRVSPKASVCDIAMRCWASIAIWRTWENASTWRVAISIRSSA